MDAQSLLSLVQDFQAWRGDVYRLAAIVADAQKEYDAKLIEANDPQDGAAVAEIIRGQ